MLDADFRVRLSAEDVMTNLKEILEDIKFKSPVIDMEDLGQLDKPLFRPNILK